MTKKSDTRAHKIAFLLLILLMLLPVPAMVRGIRWAVYAAWLLASFCILDGFLFMLNPAAGWLSSLALVGAGLFLVDRLLRYSGFRHAFREQASSHGSVT